MKSSTTTASTTTTTTDAAAAAKKKTMMIVVVVIVLLVVGGLAAFFMWKHRAALREKFGGMKGVSGYSISKRAGAAKVAEVYAEKLKAGKPADVQCTDAQYTKMLKTAFQSLIEQPSHPVPTNVDAKEVDAVLRGGAPKKKAAPTKKKSPPHQGGTKKRGPPRSKLDEEDSSSITLTGSEVARLKDLAEFAHNIIVSKVDVNHL